MDGDEEMNETSNKLAQDLAVQNILPMHDVCLFALALL